jgi:hypothetical protein
VTVRRQLICYFPVKESRPKEYRKLPLVRATSWTSASMRRSFYLGQSALLYICDSSDAVYWDYRINWNTRPGLIFRGVPILDFGPGLI